MAFLDRLALGAHAFLPLAELLPLLRGQTDRHSHQGQAKNHLDPTCGLMIGKNGDSQQEQHTARRCYSEKAAALHDRSRKWSGPNARQLRHNRFVETILAPEIEPFVAPADEFACR